MMGMSELQLDNWFEVRGIILYLWVKSDYWSVDFMQIRFQIMDWEPDIVNCVWIFIVSGSVSVFNFISYVIYIWNISD